jgi:hypothetical protein
MARTTLVIRGVIMSSHVYNGIRINVQITTLEEERIGILIQINVCHTGVTTDINDPTPAIITNGVIHQFIDQLHFSANLDLKRFLERGRHRGILDQISKLKRGFLGSYDFRANCIVPLAGNEGGNDKDHWNMECPFEFHLKPFQAN